MAEPAKPQLRVGGTTMLARVLTAVSGAGERVVVGPLQPVPAGVVIVQEQPAGSGPVAAVAAGLARVSAEFVVLLAADLPHLNPETIAALLSTMDTAAEADAALLVDETGRDQYLLSAWRADRLRTTLAGLEPLLDSSMREVVAAVRVARVKLPAPSDAPAPWTDVDTPADLDRARGHVT